MERAGKTLSILTYHSISNEPGPTSIEPGVFRAQVEALAEMEVGVVGLDQVARWMAGDFELPRPAVAITFDDAFRDFADAAFPVLERHGFSACVFAPTAIVGGSENWVGANRPSRALMGWDDIRALSRKGVEFGSHTRRHRDLTTLDEAELEDELAGSRRDLEDALGRPAPHFAPPYGRSNAAVRAAIARHYSMSVGVRLDRATRDSPIHDLPRVEMHYYRDTRRWRAFLEGRGSLYFQARRAARGLREAATGIGGSMRHRGR